MKAILHRLRQRTRSLGVKIAGRLSYWVTCKIVPKGDTSRGQIYWQDRLRWFLEPYTDRLFSWAYTGSDEEIQSVYDGEIPPFHMSERQRAEFEQYDLTGITAHCCEPECQWHGPITACHNYRCARCRKAGVWIDSFEAA
ncbi:MAG: hypothetical protein WC205_16805 [Opitutaceae bacterium]|jgi:hypothetical protein